MNTNPFPYTQENSPSGKIYQIIYPGSRLYENIYVSSRYEAEILSHIISLYLKNYVQFKPPMYLAVEGEAGEGKTSQVLATSIIHDVTVFYASASQLSGRTEGDSLQRMKLLYDDAVKFRTMGKVVSIILDDFHMSDANMLSKVERTINSTLLTGYLMNLTERPFSEQIPVILTGNDFSSVYGPLLRSGRANRLLWKLTNAEKNDIKKAILAEFCALKTQELSTFLSSTSTATVADIAQLKNDFRNRLLKKELVSIDKIDQKVLNHLDSKVSIQGKCDYRTLYELSKMRGLLHD